MTALKKDWQRPTIFFLDHYFSDDRNYYNEEINALFIFLIKTRKLFLSTT